jgi:hypothetical protein
LFLKQEMFTTEARRTPSQDFKINNLRVLGASAVNPALFALVRLWRVRQSHCGKASLMIAEQLTEFLIGVSDSQVF